MNSVRRRRWLWLAAGALLSAFVIAGVVSRKRGTAGAVPSGSDKAAAAASTPDVLLITIDTLRADAVGFAGNRRVSTPTLDRLAGQGLVFTNAHAHNVVTLASHANILTGLYPYQHGVRDNAGFRLAADVPTLATLLHEKGYATGAFVGAFPLDSRFGLNRGFDVYDDRYPKEGTGLDFDISERPASAVVAAAQQWYAATSGRPRFLWVHLYDCHTPYRPPAPFAEQYRDAPYLGEIAAVDAALGPLLAPFLDGAAPPTLVVLAGDHGESLGEHGEDAHGLFAYEATLAVPLVVWYRGIVVPGRDGRLARHVDIAPTIAGVAGIRKPASWPGASLLATPPKDSGAASYFEAFSATYNFAGAPLRGVIADGRKYIDLPLPELYDLKADPSEKQNLFATITDEIRRLHRLIPPESAIAAAARSEPNSEEVSRLRSLGYLSGGAAVKAVYTVEDDPKRLVELNREVNRCVELYQGGDLRGAIDLSRRVVRQRPAMPLAYANLAFLLRRAGDTKDALDVYRAAVARGVADDELLKHYGLALCEVGRAGEAVDVLRPLSGSIDPTKQNALGIALADAGRMDEAQAAFQSALRLDPRNVEALENMGIVLLRSEDLSGARDWFLKTLEIDQRTPRAWNGLGVVQARLGDERGAIDSWSRAVALDPTMYDALFNLGLTAAKVGRTDQARDALQRFVSAAPRSRYGADIEKAQGILRSLGAA